MGPKKRPAHIEARFEGGVSPAKSAAQSRGLDVLRSACAAAAGIALLLWPHSEKPKPTPAPAAAVAQSDPAAVDEDADASFYPLPEAEALPAVENAMVVRVQLPVSSLQLMGFPVTEERAGASVQAELLLGQDGLARGVRLVQ